MTANPITSGAGDETGFDGYLAIPAAKSGPGIVLFDDPGADADARRWAELYAAEGYVALTLSALASRDAVGGALATLRERPECTGKVSVIGFGRGCLAAIRAAAEASVECAVCYEPTDIAALSSALSRIAGSVVLHLAGSDPAVSPAIVERLRATLADPAASVGTGVSGQDAPGRRVPGAVYVYPNVKLRFTRRDAPDLDRAAAGLAHSRTIAVLRQLMGPYYDLEALWEAHIRHEFATRDVAATMATMVDDPYVNHVPVMTGGVGQRDLARFYANHFIPKCPADIVMVPISRTIGADRVVDEMVVSFTHDVEIDWMLPGVPPTGRRVEVPLVAIVGFRGDKLYHEHIYWDQASVLVQIGLLDPAHLPVAGAETAKKLLDETLPSNTLMRRWAETAPD
jgi:carboxymethylenebutenolidase